MTITLNDLYKFLTCKLGVFLLVISLFYLTEQLLFQFDTQVIEFSCDSETNSGESDCETKEELESNIQLYSDNCLFHYPNSIIKKKPVLIKYKTSPLKEPFFRINILPPEA